MHHHKLHNWAIGDRPRVARLAASDTHRLVAAVVPRFLGPGFDPAGSRLAWAVATDHRSTAAATSIPRGNRPPAAPRSRQGQAYADNGTWTLTSLISRSTAGTYGCCAGERAS